MKHNNRFFVCDFDYAMTGKRLQSNSNTTAGGRASSLTVLPSLTDQTHETVDAADPERLGNGDQPLANDNIVNTVLTSASATDALSGSDGDPSAINSGGTGAGKQTLASDSRQLTVSSTLNDGTAGDPLSPSSLMNNEDVGGVGVGEIKSKRRRRRTTRSRGLGDEADDGPSVASNSVQNRDEESVTETRNRRSMIRRMRRPSAVNEDHDDDYGEDIIVLKPCKSARRRSKRTGCKRKRSAKSRCKRRRRSSCVKPRRCRGVAKDDHWSNIRVIEVEESDLEPSDAATPAKRSRLSKRSTARGGKQQSLSVDDDDDITEAESSVSVKFSSTSRKPSAKTRRGGRGDRADQTAGSSGLSAQGRRRRRSGKRAAARAHDVDDTNDDID